jgi:glycosyltransferase involved in cell wall biosynthesis
VPGGSYSADFHPVVAMSRNLLPFEKKERRRYGCSYIGLRLLLLRFAQARTFQRVDGLIFLSRYAQQTVTDVLKCNFRRVVVIPHGVDRRFICSPRQQRAIEQYSPAAPFRIVYVSIVDLYKHQWHAATAVARLRASGLPVVLELVGPYYPSALKRLENVIERVDPRREFIRYVGPVNHEDLNAYYASADLCLFASSCENMPNILLEGMASGLPIACSNRGPMTEVLGDAAVYFDPECPEDIASALNQLIQSPEARARAARAAFDRCTAYSWDRCANETFDYLRKTAEEYAVNASTAELV